MKAFHVARLRKLVPDSGSKKILVFTAIVGVLLWDGFLLVIILALAWAEPGVGYGSAAALPLFAMMAAVGAVWGFIHGTDSYYPVGKEGRRTASRHEEAGAPNHHPYEI